MKFLRKIKKAVLLVYKRPKGFTDYCLDLFSALIKSRVVFGMPVHITIEPTNLCNLACPVCETGSGILKRSQGHMSFENFRKIIDKISCYANSIFFYHMGEPFMNKDSYKMIRYAKDKRLYVTTCTNGHFINAEELINSGIDEISFQLGGVTEETHQEYRVGSNLKEIIENIKEVIDQRRKLKKTQPKTILGLIVMKHNESQVDEFYKLTKELGLDEARILEPCVRTWKQGRQFLPKDEKYWEYDQQAFAEGRLQPKRKSGNKCNWIYISTVILNNGDIIPCCRDVQGDFVMGNILQQDLEKIWNGEKYRKFRRSIATMQDNISICKLCSSFALPGLYEEKPGKHDA